MLVQSKFKTLPGLNGSKATVLSDQRNNERPATTNRLGPFAKMLLDGTELAHRCELDLYWTRQLDHLQ